MSFYGMPTLALLLRSVISGPHIGVWPDSGFLYNPIPQSESDSTTTGKVALKPPSRVKIKKGKAVFIFKSYVHITTSEYYCNPIISSQIYLLLSVTYKFGNSKTIG